MQFFLYNSIISVMHRRTTGNVLSRRESVRCSGQARGPRGLSPRATFSPFGCQTTTIEPTGSNRTPARWAANLHVSL